MPTMNLTNLLAWYEGNEPDGDLLDAHTEGGTVF